MKTLSGKSLSQIGIGTYGIGGRGHRDLALTENRPDETYITALTYTLTKQSNFTEISLGYGHGNSIRLFNQSLGRAKVDREDLFITHSLYPRDLPSLKTLHEDVQAFYSTMQTTYADSTLVTQSLIQKFGEGAVYGLLHDLLKTKRTRFVSLSNASPTWIRKFKAEFADSFCAHEGHLSFEVRALQDKGVFSTCDELGVENIIWRPLGRGATTNRDWPLLLELSSKYKKTQGQIILNWMCKLGYRPMVFSTNEKHINENLASTGFSMTEEEYQKLTDFRPHVKGLLGINWESPSIDDDIVAQIKDIDKLLVRPSR